MALLSPTDQKLEFVTPSGSWHVSRKNFAALSDKFNTLFDFNPFSKLFISSDSDESVALIRSFTRHPNSASFDFTKDNILDFYIFCATWQIRRPLVMAVKYMLANFTEKEIVQIVLAKAIEKGVDTTELEVAISHSMQKYLPHLKAFNFYRLEKIFAKVSKDSILELTDRLVKFIVNEYKGDTNQKFALLNYLDYKECSIEQMKYLYDGGYVKHSIDTLIKEKDNLIQARTKLRETNDKLKEADEDAKNYLHSVSALFNEEHGLAEFHFLNAVRANRVENISKHTDDELLEIARREKVPEAIFETAKKQEKTDENKALEYYNELLTVYNEKSDILVSQRILELTQQRNKKLLTPILSAFVKTNRPIFLLTAYRVSLIDRKVITHEIGEKCLRRAVTMKYQEAEFVYCDRLVKLDIKKCFKFCQDRVESNEIYNFNLGVLYLFGIGCKENRNKAIEYLIKSSEKVNVANLVLAAVMKTFVHRQERYEEFLINGGKIEPITYFVNHSILGFFDQISDNLKGMKEKLLEFVISLIIEHSDSEATEFLFRRSPDLLFSLHKSTMKFVDEAEIEELRNSVKYQVPIVIDPKVKQIEERQFRENSKIDFLTIPENIETLCDRSFEKCKNIKAVGFEEGTKEIQNYVFTKCSSLRAVFLPTHSMNKIGVSAFRKDSNLIYIELPEGLEKIEEKMFFFCEKLPTVTIPKSTKIIGTAAFEGCKALEFINLTQNIEFLGIQSFQFCDSLKIVIIPKSIGTLNDRTFRFCAQLKAALIEEGIHTIKRECFHGCKALGFVSFPRKSLKKIETAAFTECPNLNHALIPKGCEVEEGSFDEGCDIQYYEDEEIEEKNRADRENEEED